ncbi:uncharacterized protein LOC106160229 isoform X2 [Lingula anatina]|uniref:Uncharacterized protein LOC106160229 isoform X2 n=1 Tax=Lingula anatina TaxID=7574 RepID=A0A1S3I306_LINAN|nr:uncharacterized protein LOC106160229 isoform X2 [Lingula anatina]|eukprot:XP_013392216.1 uncharacterized protein LOC106160229 isoform X2 [Lingula anatina]
MKGNGQPSIMDSNVVMDSLLATGEDLSLDRPNIDQLRQDRMDRNRAVMEALDPQAAKTTIPQVDKLSAAEHAAVCIQSHYRGHLGRKKYTELLYQQFEKEEALRYEKMQKQLEEGELLVANHKLEVELDDDNTKRRNKSRHFEASAITIQRAWRHHHQGHLADTASSEPDEASETESAGDQHPITSSTEDSLLEPEGHQGQILGQGQMSGQGHMKGHRPSDHVSKIKNSAVSKLVGGSECDSVVSDYSEMADPVRDLFVENEVKIVKREELAGGKNLCTGSSLEEKPERSPEETQEEFEKRVRKENYLSLAQEFAALKKINSDALPFDLHKEVNKREYSPMSEGSSVASAPVTPSDPDIELLGATTNLNKLEQNIANQNKANNNSSYQTNANDKTANQNTKDKMSANQDVASFVMMPDVIPQPKVAWGEGPANQETSAHSGLSQPSHLTQSNVSADTSHERSHKLMENGHSVSKDKGAMVSSASEELGDFDVIESTLPELDWNTIEQKLQRAAEEEKQRLKARRNDREEIRRKLAMGTDEEYYGGERTFRKPNLQTRLQSGMNLQICFVNNSLPESGNVPPVTAEGNPQGEEKNQEAEADTGFSESSAIAETTAETPLLQDKPEPELNKNNVSKAVDDEDFFAKQVQLQAEARLALAQAKPMAQMQLEIEKQQKKKQSVAEKVIGLPDGRKKLTLPVLQEMNVAQLQVLVNDMHSQIESLNEDLVKALMNRDDFHMEQDSMLVDIEDLTRRAQECAQRVSSRNQRRKEKGSS